jgi:hypothetical protein
MDMGTDDHDIPNEKDNDDSDEPADTALPEAVNEDLFNEFYKQAIDEVNKQQLQNAPLSNALFDGSYKLDDVISCHIRWSFYFRACSFQRNDLILPIYPMLSMYNLILSTNK